MAVDFVLNESQIPSFLKIQQAKHAPGDSTFSIIMADKSQFPYPGRLFFIDRAVDPQTGTIKCRIEFPNKQNLLKTGMTCNLRVLHQSSAQSILIPFKAVVEQMGEYFVFTVSDGKATQKKITLGPRINDKVVVRDGLAINEILVTEGVQKLRDGAAVQLAPQKPAGTKDATRAR